MKKIKRFVIKINTDVIIQILILLWLAYEIYLYFTEGNPVFFSIGSWDITRLTYIKSVLIMELLIVGLNILNHYVRNDSDDSEENN